MGDTKVRKRFSWKLLTLISFLAGLAIGLPISLSGIGQNDGGEFWHRTGNPETGPITYNVPLIMFDSAIWIILVFGISFLAMLLCLAIFEAMKMATNKHK